MHAHLAEISIGDIAKIEVGDVQWIRRAIEVYESTGKTLSNR